MVIGIGRGDQGQEIGRPGGQSERYYGQRYKTRGQMAESGVFLYSKVHQINFKKRRSRSQACVHTIIIFLKM
jgi:hypothetical protein